LARQVVFVWIASAGLHAKSLQHRHIPNIFFLSNYAPNLQSKLMEQVPDEFSEFSEWVCGERFDATIVSPAV